MTQDDALKQAADHLGAAIRSLTQAQNALNAATNGAFARAGTVPDKPVYQVTPEHEQRATPAPAYVRQLLSSLKRKP